MAKRQSRRSISLNRHIHEALIAFCRERNIAASRLTEDLICAHLSMARPPDIGLGPAVGSKYPPRPVGRPPGLTKDCITYERSPRVAPIKLLPRRTELPTGTVARRYTLPRRGSQLGERVILENEDRWLDSEDIYADTQDEVDAKRAAWLVDKGFRE